MINPETNDTFRAIQEFFTEHNPGFSFFLVSLSFLVSLLLTLDLWCLYTFVSYTPRLLGSVHSFFYYYTSLRGAYFAQYYVMIMVYAVIVQSFAAGIVFLQQDDSQYLLHQFPGFTVLASFFIFFNSVPLVISTLFTSQSSSLNVRDQLLVLFVLFGLSLVYYGVYKVPTTRLHKRLIFIGLLVIPLCAIIELAGFFLIMTAPHA